MQPLVGVGGRVLNCRGRAPIVQIECAPPGLPERRNETNPLTKIEMLRRLGPTTRLSLAIGMLSWLLLQTVLTLLGRDPAMLDIGRGLTLVLIVAIPLCVWLLRTVCPDADFPPKKLETLLMVAAFGFATAMVLRWALRTSRPPDAALTLAAAT